MKVTFENFEITATYSGSKAADWGNKHENWNHHRITVKNVENRRWAQFDFWASIAHPKLDGEYDVLNAFYCFVSDAISGSYTYEEFCDEFGYDEDSRRAEKTWKACKRTSKKLARIYEGDIYDLSDKLQGVAG